MCRSRAAFALALLAASAGWAGWAGAGAAERRRCAGREDRRRRHGLRHRAQRILVSARDAERRRGRTLRRRQLVLPPQLGRGAVIDAGARRPRAAFHRTLLRRLPCPGWARCAARRSQGPGRAAGGAAVSAVDAGPWRPWRRRARADLWRPVQQRGRAGGAPGGPRDDDIAPAARPLRRRHAPTRCSSRATASPRSPTGRWTRACRWDRASRRSSSASA